MSNYQSVFYPHMLDRDYKEWVYYTSDYYNKLSEKELIAEYERLEKELEQLRANEPAKKRKRKSKYYIWVQRSLDLNEEMQMLCDELAKRRNERYIQDRR